ncbi:MAG: ATP-dependent DNA helicase [Acidobacteriia bacterium]|nr:ATP-dependent DNA helicase [Terriglobia bacterium]
MHPIPIRLNLEQEAAVKHPAGPLLIIAGAGTGKTRVITERAAYLLESEPNLKPENVVALTFTERATEEMAARIHARVGDRAAGKVHVHTFHSFALKLLREQPGGEEAVRNTELLDNVDFWILLRRHIERLRLEVFWKNAAPGQFLRDLIEFMSRAHDELVSVEDYESYVEALQLEGDAAAASGLQAADFQEQMKKEREIARVYRVATELLAEAGARTFGDVITAAVRLLRDEGVRRHYQERLRAILVDEFQDTNVAQIELLHLLAGSHRNITVVGDDDQAIYRFRGASFESFNMFAQKFPEFQKVKLTQNYRSTQRILRMSNQLIRVNPDRFDPDKNLWTEKPAGEPVRLFESSEPDDEALALAERIDQLHHAGRPWNHLAVLFRARRHRELLLAALRRRGIPFRVVGISVLGDPQVRDLFSAARFFSWLHDSISCARLLGLRRWNLTEHDCAALSRRTSEQRKAASGRPSLFDVMTDLAADAAHPLNAKVKLFVEWTQAMHKQISGRPAAAFFKALAAELAERQARMGGMPATDSDYHAEEMAPAVRRVVEFVEAWQKKNGEAPLKHFLGYWDLFLEAGGDVPEKEEEQPQDSVRLMTVHAAKGLEFPMVFVLRLTQGSFPTRERPPLLPFPEALRKEGELPLGNIHLQEERRLCYVAMTRAQDELYLSTVVKPRWKRSDFLADLDSNRALASREMEKIVVAPSGEQLDEDAVLDPGRNENDIPTSRLPYWALRNARVLPSEPSHKTLQLSASAMETYSTCPAKYKFAYEYKLAGGPSPALTVGALMHECIREFFAMKKARDTFAFGDLQQFFEGRWRSIGFEDQYQEARYRQNALDQLRRFYDKNLPLPAAVMAQEKGFEFSVGDVTVIGRIDQINELSSTDVELIDYKTGRPRTQKDADHNLQLSVYALACRESLHRHPAQLAFYNLESGEKVVTERSDAQLQLERQKISDVAREIRERRFPPRKNFFCPLCEFLSICPAFEGESPPQ